MRNGQRFGVAKFGLTMLELYDLLVRAETLAVGTT